MKKKVLFLGAGFLQSFAIRKAKELGYYVLALDGDEEAEGFRYCDEYAAINFVDKEKSLQYAVEHNIDGVITAATDYGVLSMSYVASRMGLPGINYHSAELIKNKALVRKCLYDSRSDDTGYSYEICNEHDIEEKVGQISFPVMVKPIDGSGSRGASKVDRTEDFKEACLYAMSGSISHRAVAEPFIDGQEYGVESFVESGDIHILAIMQKDMTKPPYYAELGHAVPSGLPELVEERIRECVKKALIAMNVNHGSVNMDILVSKNDSVHIVDVGARMGGNLIGSHIIPIGTGIDYMGNMIRAAVGDKTIWERLSEPRNVATKLLALNPGIVKKLPDFKELETVYGVKIEHHLHIGDEITPYRTNLDGCGYVVATGQKVDDAISKAALVKSIIDSTIERA